VPPDPGYAEAVLGLHVYTWALLVFVAELVAAGLNLTFAGGLEGCRIEWGTGARLVLGLLGFAILAMRPWCSSRQDCTYPSTTTRIGSSSSTIWGSGRDNPEPSGHGDPLRPRRISSPIRTMWGARRASRAVKGQRALFRARYKVLGSTVTWNARFGALASASRRGRQNAVSLHGQTLRFEKKVSSPF
jgi:hypothetical protein